MPPCVNFSTIYLPGPVVALPNPSLPVQALLQDLLPVTKHLHNVHQSQQGLQEGTYLTATDYLEYVDKQTGFTPLLAAVFNHREQCAKLVRNTTCTHHFPRVYFGASRKA